MIKVLDSFVADKIAAGEVIERPVSAVKELVENSLDAGARSVIVEIRKGGKSYIRVTDDGCGISFDEAETAFLRHATSKISGISDLENIVTLGFRGEALASISAVSMLTMVTRTSDQTAGTRIVLHGGRVVSKERTGTNPGTTIIVENLFYNTPARRKFMKSDAREASSVIELIQQFAVCRSDVRFMMINNGQTLFTTNGDGDTFSVIELLYPEIARQGLIPVSGSCVSGFVSGPGNTMNTRRGQLYFVNGRLVSGTAMEKGLEEGYHGRVFSGFPAAVLFITADPADIDVNIHPGKREIRFLKQNEITDSISDAVSRAVMSDAGVPKGFVKNIESSDRKGLNIIPTETENAEQTSIRDFLISLDRDTKEEAPAFSVAETADTEYEAFSQPAERPRADMDLPLTAPFDFNELVFKGYVLGTYIIMQGKDDIYIFDQHAAHERIFYEKFMQSYNDSSHSPQPLLTPFTLEVSPDVYSMDRAWLSELRLMGYDIEDFGGCTFMIRGIPPYMTLTEAEGFASGYASAAEETGGINKVVKDKLIMRSCKSAVKANDVLSEAEILELMEKLAACGNPYSCPHGRPTFIKLTRYDIERSFHRK